MDAMDEYKTLRPIINGKNLYHRIPVRVRPPLPCPFCGSQAERADVPANDYTRAIDPEFKGEACIVCMYCGASVCGHDYMEALGRWNHRAKEPMTGGKLACECNGAEAGFSYGDLVDWYINSVSPDDKPVWTEGHIEELMKDFILFPRTGATA